MENKKIFSYLNKLSKNSSELTNLIFNKHREKLADYKDHIFSEINFSQFNKILVNEEICDIILIEDNIVKSIYEFGANENSEYNELTETFNYDNFIPSISTKFIIIDLKNGLFGYKKPNKPKYLKNNENYEFQIKKLKREEKSLELIFTKAIFESFVKFEGNTDNIEEIKRHFSLLIINVFKILYERKLLFKLIDFNLNATDFEYDLTRGKMFLDFKLTYSFINKDGKLAKSLYSSIMSRTKRLKSQDKLVILNCTLFKMLLGFVEFTDLFIERKKVSQLNNLMINGFPKEFKSKFNNVYSIFTWN